MKKLLTLALSVLGFILIAAPTAVEYHDVFLNGRMLGRAAKINGIIAISVADISKAGGGALNLEEAGLTLTSNTLNVSSRVANEYKHKISDPQKKVVAGNAVIKGESHALWRINPLKPQGTITTRAFKFGNQTRGGVEEWWVPVQDLANAFGGGLLNGNLGPNQPIQLRSTSTGILIGL